MKLLNKIEICSAFPREFHSLDTPRMSHGCLFPVRSLRMSLLKPQETHNNEKWNKRIKFIYITGIYKGGCIWEDMGNDGVDA